MDTVQNDSVDRTIRGRTLLALAAWFVAACAAGLLGMINAPGRPPLGLLVFVVVPILGFVTVYLTSAAFRSFADRLSLRFLVGSHIIRFVGLGFIIATATGDLAAGFGMPAGIGDIVVAAAALALLPKIGSTTAQRGWLLAWNTLGMADLLIALTTGVLYSNSTLGILSSGTVTTKLVAAFPVSLIPTFFVPLFLLIHALLFKRMADLGTSGRGVDRGHRLRGPGTMPA